MLFAITMNFRTLQCHNKGSMSKNQVNQIGDGMEYIKESYYNVCMCVGEVGGILYMAELLYIL